jgi:hypothetical protein
MEVCNAYSKNHCDRGAGNHIHNPEPDRPCGGILALDLKNTELLELRQLIEQSTKRP